MAQRKTSYKNQSLFRLVLIIVLAVLVNVVSSAFYQRMDLTANNRYTLTSATVDMLEDIDRKVFIRVYLAGNLPSGFQRLKKATEEMLAELRAYSDQKIDYQFINTQNIKGKKKRQQLYRQLTEKGLKPTNLKVQNSSKSSQQIIFPGAIITYQGGKKELPVDLLQNQPGMGPQQSINNSIAGLEYEFASVLRKLQLEEQQQLAFIRGHNELAEAKVGDIINHLNRYYKINWLNLNDVLTIPQRFDAIVIAKPRQAFPEQHKFIIDQYIMHGGKVLWLVDKVKADLDSLRNEKSFLARGRRLNIKDQLFQYGARINETLIQDMQCNPIPLMGGYTAGKRQQQLKPWYYYPLILPSTHHPIVENLDAIMFRFANSIDTVGGKGIDKEVLLHSSQHSRIVRVPSRVNLSMLKYQPPAGMFDNPYQPVSVLLEGSFTSLFKNRLTPNTLTMLDSLEMNFKAKSPENKMIVVADGDVIKNDLNDRGQPLPLGYYKYTRYTFANKEFISNAIEYLCDNTGIIKARKKNIKLRLLDEQQVQQQRLTWQLVNMIGPLLFVGLFGFIFNFVRIRKYGYQ